jgi:DNA polymerase III subunit gamma/tau
MTLYLKYRPQTIDELDSQVVRNQLTALISSNRLPHAFLFSGPKGTGKTSTARILAKIVNCEKNKDKLGEPCNKCDYCTSTVRGNNFDVIEMDAASNRGIDDIRALKEKIILSPGSARKKIYIIDEVHMLTTEAFNALLKTLEEPPEHVLFILATTDAHKLPDTVRSRLTNIVFEKAKDEEIVRQLVRVSKGEDLKIEEDSLYAIAKVSDGSFRDAVKTLEGLIINVADLTNEKVQDYLFQTKIADPKDILQLIREKKASEAIETIEKFVDQGGSVKNLILDLFNLLHKEVTANTKNDNMEDTISLVSLFTQAKQEMVTSPIVQLPLEIAIIKFSGGAIKNEIKSKDSEIKSTLYSNEQNKPDNSPQSKKKVIETQEVDKQEVKKETLDPVNLAKVDDSSWFKILQSVRSRSASVEGFLRAAKPFGIAENKFKIGVFYRFHKEQLEAFANKKHLEECINEVLGADVRVEFVLTEKADMPNILERKFEPSLTVAQEPNIIDAAKEIFG